MLTSRALPREEWGKLSGSPLDVALPETASVIVVEDAGEIVGSWMALSVLHLHGLNITADRQKHAAVFRRLLVEMSSLVRSYDATGAFTTAETDEVRSILETYGAEQVRGDGYVVRLKERA